MHPVLLLVTGIWCCCGILGPKLIRPHTSPLPFPCLTSIIARPSMQDGGWEIMQHAKVMNARTW